MCRLAQTLDGTQSQLPIFLRFISNLADTHQHSSRWMHLKMQMLSRSNLMRFKRHRPVIQLFAGSPPNPALNRTLYGVPSLGKNSSPNSARRKVPVNFYVRRHTQHLFTASLTNTSVHPNTKRREVVAPNIKPASHSLCFTCKLLSSLLEYHTIGD